MRLLAATLLIVFAWPILPAAAALEPQLQSKLEKLLPGEEISVVVTLANQVTLDRFLNNTRKLRSLSAAGRRQHRQELITALKDKATATQGPLSNFLHGRGARQIESLWIFNGLTVTASRALIEELAVRPEVAEVRLNGTLQLPVYTVSQTTGPEWNLLAIHAPELWGLGFTGQGVVIATLDSGVDLNHVALGAKWRGGSNSWFDPYGEHPALPFDADGHGTAVTGILVGGSADGTPIGVAPGARWIAAKIFNDVGVAENSRIHQAFQWLLDPDGNPGTDDSPDIVNNSWGLDLFPGACLEEFRADVQALRAAGIAMTFAGGNTGGAAGSDISPANYPESFAVGAIDQSLAIPLFSARGPSSCDGALYPEVVAPGVHIKVADLTLGGVFPAAYAVVEGTSFASPHVAGAMALLLSAQPGQSVGQLEVALRQTAADIGQTGADNSSGSGLINLLAAYSYLADHAPNIAILPSASYFNFGRVPVNGSSSQSFTITNVGVTDLLIGDMALSGANLAEFSLGSDSCSLRSLAPNASCSFMGAFTPQTPGYKTATLQIPSNDPDTPFAAITLAGNREVRVGVFRAGQWFLDKGDLGWQNTDTVYPAPGFGAATDIPVAGDMNGDGVSEVGVYRPATGAWYFDLDGNGAWSGCGLDLCLTAFGAPTDLPVVGDWDGNGRDEVGVYRQGQWYFDMDGNGTWNPAIDAFKQAFGAPSDLPVAGDWNGDGKDEIGVYRQGTWYLDNGNGRWDAGIDMVIGSFGAATDLPVAGDVDDDGCAEVGVYRPSTGLWYFDLENNGWTMCLADGGTDLCVPAFGAPTDKPVLGVWQP